MRFRGNCAGLFQRNNTAVVAKALAECIVAVFASGTPLSSLTECHQQATLHNVVFVDGMQGFPNFELAIALDRTADAGVKQTSHRFGPPTLLTINVRYNQTCTSVSEPTLSLFALAAAPCIHLEHCQTVQTVASHFSDRHHYQNLAKVRVTRTFHATTWFDQRDSRLSSSVAVGVALQVSELALAVVVPVPAANFARPLAASASISLAGKSASKTLVAAPDAVDARHQVHSCAFASTVSRHKQSTGVSYNKQQQRHGLDICESGHGRADVHSAIAAAVGAGGSDKVEDMVSVAAAAAPTCSKRYALCRRRTQPTTLCLRPMPGPPLVSVLSFRS